MRTRTLLSVSTAVAAGVLFAGCTASVAPKQTLSDALTKTSGGAHQTVTMKLDTTADDLRKAIEAAASDGDASALSGVEPFIAIVPKVAITTSVHAHEGDLNQPLGLESSDLAFSIAVDGKPLEVRWVDSALFLRADVEGLGQATGLFTATQVKMMVGQFTNQFPWVANLIDGDWMTLDEATSAKIVDFLKENAGAENAKSEVDIKKVTEGWLEASTVTKVDDATLKVTTDAAKLITAMAAVSDTDDLDEADAQEIIDGLNEGADLDMTVTVKDGKVSKVVTDIADVMRTWPKPDPKRPSIAKMAATEFKLDAVAELNGDDPKIEAPSATTIPGSDLDSLLGVR